MSLPKEITIELLRDTWPHETPPQSLVQVQARNPYRIDALSCLLFTALLTRPPVMYGFSLSDCWAWLRYIPALSQQRQLRLRPEWTHLDPHQKTVLSEELGVGFTTWFLHRALGFEKYADTLWVVNTKYPGAFTLERSAKQGQFKSPDYIAVDRSGHFNVLECKGTQTSRKDLLKAIGRGRPQKDNLRAVGTTQIQHSLVAGLYIPQYQGPGEPTLAIADPDWAEVKMRLGQFTPDELRRGVTQIAAAKEMALMELPETARSLARDKGAAESVPDAFELDLQRSIRRTSPSRDQHRVVHEYRWPTPARIAEEITVVGVRFEARLAARDISALRTVGSPVELAERMSDESHQLRWSETLNDVGVKLKSPLGNEFELSLLEA